MPFTRTRNGSVGSCRSSQMSRSEIGSAWPAPIQAWRAASSIRIGPQNSASVAFGIEANRRVEIEPLALVAGMRPGIAEQVIEIVEIGGVTPASAPRNAARRRRRAAPAPARRRRSA